MEKLGAVDERELIARAAEATDDVRGAGEAAGEDELPPKYNGLADPPGAEELGRRLAERLRGEDPTLLVVWEDPEDVVLGHVVGRELGLSVVRAYDADGLVGTSGALPDAPRIALVTDAVRDARAVRAARALADRAGGSLVATAVLTGSTVLDGVAGEAGAIVALVPAAASPSGAVG